MSHLTCVRCGAAPREGTTFLCAGCRVNPETSREITKAITASASPTDHAGQRQVLTSRFNWSGGWSGRSTLRSEQQGEGDLALVATAARSGASCPCFRSHDSTVPHSSRSAIGSGTS